MGRMSELVEGYIAYKRSLGYKILTEAHALRRFARFADGNHPGEPLSSGLALAWVGSFGEPSDWYRARLYETVRTFSRYACIADEGSTMLPKGRGRCHGMSDPYIYGDDEIVALMEALSGLHSPDGLRAESAPAMCGLMRSCGLRPSECARLAVGDYDSAMGCIDVVATKFNRSRRVPLSDSAAAHVESHLSRIPAGHAGAPMFPTTGGRPFGVRALEYAWKVTRDVLLPEGTPTWDRRPPRPYDVRHTFATRTLEGWLASGADVDAMMPRLSAYLGHQKLADTYWYLAATDGLLGTASDMFGDYVRGGGQHE